MFINHDATLLSLSGTIIFTHFTKGSCISTLCSKHKAKHLKDLFSPSNNIFIYYFSSSFQNDASSPRGNSSSFATWINRQGVDLGSLSPRAPGSPPTSHQDTPMHDVSTAASSPRNHGANSDGPGDNNLVGYPIGYRDTRYNNGSVGRCARRLNFETPASGQYFYNPNDETSEFSSIDEESINNNFPPPQSTISSPRTPQRNANEARCACGMAVYDPDNDSTLPYSDGSPDNQTMDYDDVLMESSSISHQSAPPIDLSSTFPYSDGGNDNFESDFDAEAEYLQHTLNQWKRSN